MYICILFFLYNFIHNSEGLIIKNIYSNRNTLQKLNMLNEEYINLIQKNNDFFYKENVIDLINNINSNKISEIFISKDYKELIGVDNLISTNIYDKFHLTQVAPVEIQYILNKGYDHNIPIYFIDFYSKSNVISVIENTLGTIFNISSFLVPLFFIFLLIRNFNSFGSQISSMNSVNMINRNPNSLNKENNLFLTPNVSLSSWAGSPEVLEECKEVVSFLDNTNYFELVGAEMPKGILLEGPPGTGKTLLAKGIATETNSTFISVSGAEFVELFVGMGAARVRELFKNARENSPCIIFIDEIDAIGKQRGIGATMATNDEREQTLNQILFEMDGFTNNDGILILAATNRKDILDKALLRPGRFDRIIKVPLPDKFSREKILSYYFSLKKIEPNIDVTSLAEITDGFSGAELKNLINEAAILTAREKRVIIGEKDLFNAFEKIIVGLIRNNNAVSLNTRTRVAVHESGHAIMALRYPDYFDLQKVSIQATYSGAGGYTIFSEKPEIKEGGLYTRDLLKKRLIVTMGGKAAENVYYGNDFVSLGAIQDLKQANQLAQKMIGNFGMGEKLEVFFNENINDDNVGFYNNKYSEYTKFNMDKETMRLVIEAYNESLRILNENKDLLYDMRDLLLNNTVINKKDIPHYFF
jgi:cell division protease FtsH